MKNVVKLGHADFELSMWTDTQTDTDKQTDILITILRNPDRVK